MTSDPFGKHFEKIYETSKRSFHGSLTDCFKISNNDNGMFQFHFPCKYTKK